MFSLSAHFFPTLSSRATCLPHMTETLQPLQADAVATESSKLEEHAFRVYADDNEPVKNMYLRNHETQTLLNVKALRERYCSQPTIKMKIWDAMEALNDM